MSRDNLEPLVAWTPELSAEDRAYADEIRARVRPALTFVRDFRQSLGLSQIGVAELLDMTQSNVSKIERKNDLPLSSLSRLARAQHKRVRIVIESEDGKEQVSFAVP